MDDNTHIRCKKVTYRAICRRTRKTLAQAVTLFHNQSTAESITRIVQRGCGSLKDYYERTIGRNVIVIAKIETPDPKTKVYNGDGKWWPDWKVTFTPDHASPFWNDV